MKGNKIQIEIVANEMQWKCEKKKKCFAFVSKIF